MYGVEVLNVVKSKFAMYIMFGLNGMVNFVFEGMFGVKCEFCMCVMFFVSN